jgi:hypothetical protein
VANVYSQLLAAFNLTAGVPQTATVPTGKVWVVRDMFLHWITTSGSGIVEVVDTFTSTYLWYLNLPPATQPEYHWHGHQVMLQDTNMVIAVTGSIAANIRVSGYELSLP